MDKLSDPALQVRAGSEGHFSFRKKEKKPVDKPWLVAGFFSFQRVLSQDGMNMGDELPGQMLVADLFDQHFGQLGNPGRHSRS